MVGDFVEFECHGRYASTRQLESDKPVWPVPAISFAVSRRGGPHTVSTFTNSQRHCRSTSVYRELAVSAQDTRSLYRRRGGAVLSWGEGRAPPRPTVSVRFLGRAAAVDAWHRVERDRCGRESHHRGRTGVARHEPSTGVAT